MSIEPSGHVIGSKLVILLKPTTRLTSKDLKIRSHAVALRQQLFFYHNSAVLLMTIIQLFG